MSGTVRPLRVAILAHSTNPRGGVIHALELADALVRLGHEPVVHAPDPTGRGFFRATLAKTLPIAASAVGGDVADAVETRIADYLRHFEPPANRRYDVFHAQDGISGNALATLKERGLIKGFARTVHHLDVFRDPRLEALQARSVRAAHRYFTVSQAGRDALFEAFGLASTIVGNGVDRSRFSPLPDGREVALRRRFDLGVGAVFLSVGGVEERKNSVRLLDAFRQVRATIPSARLVIAGGASLLDHQAYQARFAQTLEASGLPSDAVICTGPVPQAEMAALYRIADALVFPSVKEGFGLVVLEAMACGIPVVTSRIEPFTEYLGEGDVIWCDPLDVASIADAMVTVLSESRRHRLVANGAAVAGRHDWGATARAHVRAYESLQELHHA